MTTISLHTMAVVGFGEAGSILGEDLAAGGRDVITYDILLDVPASRAAPGYGPPTASRRQ